MSKIIKNIKRTANRTINKIEKGTNQVINRIDSTADALINGREGYGPVIQQFLNKYGDSVIYSMQIVKNPVNAAVQGALNLVSGNKVSKLPFDKLYHLSANIETSKGILNIEKNEFINMRAQKQEAAKDGEFFNLQHNFNGITLNQLLDNARKYMGDTRFFNYNASSSNCQDWILGILHGNQINDSNVDAFVKQDASTIFSDKKGITRKIANSVVDLGKIGNILVSGGVIKKKSKC